MQFPNSPHDDHGRKTEFDHMGRQRPRNAEEARLLASQEFNHLQILQKKKQKAQLLELQEMKRQFDQMVAEHNKQVSERRAGEIDYIGELDVRIQANPSQKHTIPKSLRDMEEKYYAKIKQMEEDYENKWGAAANADSAAPTKEQTKPLKKKEKMEPIQTSLIATLSETRSTGELKMYYDRVVDLWHTTYPKRFVPALQIKIVPQENQPFCSMVIGNECHLTPLTLGMTPRALRKLFVKATPDYVESEQRLIDATDTMYFTPERLQFVFAKSLSEASIGGPNNIATWAKLKLFKLTSRQRYVLYREKIEMKTDTMSAHLSPAIAIGGIEHLAKLNGFYEFYQHDIPLDDDSVMADVRLMNLLNVAESVHGLKKSDSLRLALNNRVTLSGNSRNLVGTVTRSLDSQLLRDHITRHYPKTINIDPIDV